MKEIELQPYKELIMKHHAIRHDGEQMFFYNSKLNEWETHSGNKAIMAMNQLLSNVENGNSLSASTIKSLMADILCDPSFYRPIKMSPTELVNCRSGVVNLDTMQVQPASIEDDFTMNVDFMFDEGVNLNDCPVFENFLKFAFNIPHSTSQEDVLKVPTVRRLLEMLGYLISNEFRAKKLLLLVGPANSGKSQVLELLRMVLGHANTVALTLDELSGHSGGRFRTQLLQRAHALINDEIPTRGLRHLAELKKVIAGEPITIEAKGANPLTVKNYTKLIFAGNQLPELDEPDCGNAFASRICAVILKNSASATEKDVNLVNKLFDERHAIFSLALFAFSEMRKDHLTFTEDPEAEKMIRSYMAENNSVMTFINESGEVAKGIGVHTTQLYERYKSFCEKEGYSKVKNLKVFRQQISCLPGISFDRVRLDEDINPRSAVLGIELVYKEAE